MKIYALNWSKKCCWRNVAFAKESAPTLGSCPRVERGDSVFQTRQYNLSAPNIHLEGNIESCINCGQDAKVVDGIYKTVDGVIQLISSPEIQKAQYEELSRLITKAQSGEVSVE